jgi:L-ascorbate metabolism protein UlaG (beta-lactamase superfamily)
MGVIQAWSCVLALGAALAVGQDLEATYLANEGVLLRSGTSAVLVDALFGEGLEGYPAVASEQRERLERAEPPFDAVTLVLATHRHRDHFEPAAVARFLAANTRAQFLSTPQAASELGASLAVVGGGASIAGRVHSTLPAAGALEHHELGGVSLRVAQLHHGVGSEIQNLGFLIELGGVRVLHVGDTSASAADLAPLALHREGIDLALLPVWYFSFERLVPAVSEQMRPRRSVAFHFAAADAPSNYHGPASSLESLVRLVEERAPEVELWTQPGQRLVVSPDPSR